MHIPDELQQHIDRYISGEMTGKEAVEFEEMIKNDPGLLEEVEDQKHIIQLIKEYHDQEELKVKLQEAENEYYEQETKKKKRILTINWMLIMTSAASVAILATFITLYITGWFNYGKHVNAYELMNKKINVLATNQETLNKVIKSKANTTKIIPTYPTGTCFLISANGYLATNYHVVKNIDSLVIVNYTDSTNQYKAKVVYKDLKHDIAILYVTDSLYTSGTYPPYMISRNKAGLGEYVYTLGFSKKDLVFGEGSVSSMTGFNEDTIAYQISIPVNPGNSGGPLISETGDILGIISGKHINIDGATYAVKSEYLLNIVDSLSKDTTLNKPIMARYNKIKWLKRNDQVKHLKPYIYKVQVYMNKVKDN